MGTTMAGKFATPSILGSRGAVGAMLAMIWLAMVLILWGFAFMPAPAASPEWLLRTQAVCFGTLANGLPAPHGWMLLILSPLALLSVMWASHPQELAEAPAFVRGSKPLKVLLALMVAMVFLEGHWTGTRITQAVRLARWSTGRAVQNSLPQDYPRIQMMVPAFELINQNGQTINQEIFRGKITILTFAFAHCASICPMLIRDALDAQRRVESPDLQTVVISIDPWRDTPSSLPSLAKSWSMPAGAQLLSGSPSDVSRTLEGFQIASARDLKTGDINHAAQTMIIDRQGRVAYSFLNASVEWIATGAGRLLSE